MNYILKKIFKSGIIKSNFEYLLGGVGAQALGFISIPIITRLLSPEEYGIVSIYNSIVSISLIVLGLNISSAIKRYYYENNNDFGNMLGANIIFISIINIIVVILLFLNLFMGKLQTNNGSLFLFAIITVVLRIYNDIYMGYLEARRESKKFAILNISIKFLITIITIFLLLFGKGYFSEIIASVLVYFIIFIYSFKNIIRISKIKFDFKYIKYSIKYSLPLVPATLSTFVLVHSDRLMIQNFCGYEDAGIYSFAYNVGMIMNLVVIAVNRAWNPIFYSEYKNENYTKIENLANNISKYILVAAMFIIFFSKELVNILSSEKYYESINIIPIIVIGYVFVFLYTIFFQYALYYKATILISINSVIAGIINIALNYILIPEYGYKIAACTTVISYVILSILHYINCRYVIKAKVIDLKKIFIKIGYMLFFVSIYYFLQKMNLNFFYEIILKIIIVAIYLVIMFNRYIVKFINLMRGI